MNDINLIFGKTKLIDVWGSKVFLANDKAIAASDIGKDLLQGMINLGFDSGKEYNVQFTVTFEEVK